MDKEITKSQKNEVLSMTTQITSTYTQYFQGILPQVSLFNQFPFFPSQTTITQPQPPIGLRLNRGRLMHPNTKPKHTDSTLIPQQQPKNSSKTKAIHGINYATNPRIQI